MGVAGEGVLCTTHVGEGARGHRSPTRGSHRRKSMKVFFVFGQWRQKNKHGVREDFATLP